MMLVSKLAIMLAIPPILTDVSAHGPSVCMCVSATLVPKPLDNEIPFGRDILVVPSNVVFTGREDLGSEPPIAVISQSPAIHREQLTPLLVFARYQHYVLRQCRILPDYFAPC